MDKVNVKRIAVSTAAVASLLLGASLASAQDKRIQEVVNEVNQSNKLAQASQQRIDGIADATSKLFVDYKTLLKNNAGLRAYNAQQSKIIREQEKDITEIKEVIGQIDEIKRQVTPLMIEMADNLEEFIKADIPFQLSDRTARLETIRTTFDNPNVADPERFRVVLEAYKAEVQYGRTRNAYEGQLEDGRTVNFIRIGRVGFYYQTKDGHETAVWNKKANGGTGGWQQLDAEYATSVRQLLRMARQQVPVDVLVLPVTAPERKS